MPPGPAITRSVGSGWSITKTTSAARPTAAGESAAAAPSRSRLATDSGERSWTVSNASPNPSNGHFLNANQRFAIDFYITEEEGGKRKSHRERGKQNADYFAFGQEVLAPADGTVLQVVDGVPDNTPGQTDVYYRIGNTVVLSLGNGEYAHLCHLQNGSTRVRPGDQVRRGQVLARCGNSGNSTSPHLHFQLTDGPLFSHSASLPAYFKNVLKSGTLTDLVLPMSGDRLAPRADKPKASAR